MVLRLLNVEKHYAVADQRVPALNGVSLDLGRGEWLAVVGRSGCGKTTLLNLAGAADLPTSGHVEIEGVRTSSLDDDALTELRRRRIGFVFQFLQLLPTLNAVENVELPLQLAGTRRPRGRAAEMLEMVGIAALADRHPHQLSGGEMQRVAIARALVHGPGLLLADEPTGSLDDEAAASIIELLRDMRERLGTSILMATHSPEAAAAADRRLTLRDVNLGFAGRKPLGDPIHRAIAELAPGEQLQVRPESDRWDLRNDTGIVVGTLARKFEPPPDMRCIEATVLAVATWSRDRSDPKYQQRLKNDTWEVVIPELVFEPLVGESHSTTNPGRCPADEGR